ncbi:hypothetical protein K4K49_005372 [Colletotrichum sp. SAR 10_70]|nr:hypothetical protein K4K50_009018 [Colletotrichum sp. SAR 10_71]KAI8166989.1 hypothetical protein K4K49_005372 [Colletotrichum sp. SAR 10_70]KAI8194022.1 hypothetical protein KHU50_012060 [Colletotrichum sp. SAR 10_65]KAI8207831.1 hypothetical protein K4K52_001912 [Colletotrichum sp. SAR 10_76]KAI8251833.1 hypothetical protein K4K53_011820 [Colletotrichum sp. SAR 10_77]KAI8257378.1 hypothetical protein K4K58_004232 [Colletotrichum sp. SAR11_239]
MSPLPSNISDEKYQAFVNAHKELITNKFLLTRDDFDLRSTRSEPRGRLPGQPLNAATSLREMRRSTPTRRPVTAAPASKRTAGRRNTTYAELVDLVDEEEECGEEEEEQEEEILEEEEEEEEELEQDVPETMVNKDRVRAAIRNFVVSSESTARAEVEMRLALYEMLRHDVEDVDPEPEVVAGPSRHRAQVTKSTPAKSTPAKSSPAKAKPKTTKKTVKGKGKGKMTARATRERDIDDLMNLF